MGLIWLQRLRRRRSKVITPAKFGAPQPTAITAQRVRVTVDSDGFLLERRDGLSGWTTSHRLRWPEIKSMYIDTGTLDSPLGLYATMNTGNARRHLFDTRLLTRQEWTTLANSVAMYSRDKVVLDLSGFERTRPFNEF